MKFPRKDALKIRKSDFWQFMQERKVIEEIDPMIQQSIMFLHLHSIEINIGYFSCNLKIIICIKNVSSLKPLNGNATRHTNMVMKWETPITMIFVNHHSQTFCCSQNSTIVSSTKIAICWRIYLLLHVLISRSLPKFLEFDLVEFNAHKLPTSVDMVKTGPFEATHDVEAIRWWYNCSIYFQ